MQEQTLSAVLRVKNEEHRILHQHLANLKTFCNEIIITVESNSTDNTFAICKEYTDKVYMHEHQGFANPDEDYDFAGIKYAISDWLLLVDADFMFSKILIAEIKQAMQQTEYVGFKIPCCHMICGKWFTHREHWQWHDRLFKRGSATYKRIDLHTRVFEYNGKESSLKNPLFHYGLPELSEWIEKNNHYSTIDLPSIIEHKKGGAFKRASLDTITTQNLLEEPLDFIKKMLYKQGYAKEKEHGYIFAFVFGMYMFMENAKLYEYKWKKEHNWQYGKLDDIEQVAEEIRTTQFNQKKSYIRGIFRKIKNILFK